MKNSNRPRSSARIFLQILRKDLLLEFRAADSLIFFLMLSALLAVMAGLGLQSAFLSARDTLRVYPLLLWLSFFFASTLTSYRSFEKEELAGALDRIRMSQTPVVLIFASKLLCHLLIQWGTLAATALLLALLLQLPLSPAFLALLLFLPMGILGGSSLCLLLSALLRSSRLGNLLLPLLLFPLLIPYLLLVIELSTELLDSPLGSINAMQSALLLFLNIVYLSLGFFLFPASIHE